MMPILFYIFLVDSIASTSNPSGPSSMAHFTESPWAKTITWLTPLLLAVSGFVLWLYRYIKQRQTPIRVSHKFSDPVALQLQKQHFVPNSINIPSSSIAGDTISENSIDYLVDQLLGDNQSIHFIEATTGIGKTTYLVNLFHAYLAKAKPKKRTPSILLADYNDLAYQNSSLLHTYISRSWASKTILLIDALDEFTAAGNFGTTNYWQQFGEKWASISSQLVQFKKVIVTVREQFFNEQNIAGSSLAGQPFQTIRLLPFSPTQAAMYLDSKYQGDKQLPGIKQLVDKIYQQNHDSAEAEQNINVPLILSYAKEIYSYHKSHEAIDSSHYALYEAIVQGWMVRELHEKRYDSLDIQNITFFCQNIAFEISKTNVPFIPEETILTLNAQSNFINIFNHGERSLLKRVKRPIQVDGHWRYRNHYEFIHKSFLAFFLAQGALQRADLEQRFDFDRHAFAQSMFIRKRWQQKRADVPVPQDYDHSRTNSQQTFETFTSLGYLKQWHRFFHNFTSNTSIDRALRSADPTQGLTLLTGQHPHLVPELIALRNLQITNYNLYDFDQEDFQTPCAEVIDLIYYIKRLIGYVVLENLPKNADTILTCFDGADYVSHLCLLERTEKYEVKMFFWSRSEEISEFQPSSKLKDSIFNPKATRIIHHPMDGSCLRFFERSKGCLEHLVIHGNHITDDKLLPFDGVEKIKTLMLSSNKLAGNCFEYFAASKHCLAYLDTEDNLITNDRYFRPFIGANQLHSLALGNNGGLLGTCLEYFKDSKLSLQQISLDSLEIKDIMLAPFNGAAKIELLSLSHNKLDGSALTYFSKSLNTLKGLYLDSNLINDPTLFSPLDGATALMFVSLANNPVGGNTIVNYLMHSRNTLESFEITVDGRQLDVRDSLVDAWNSSPIQ